MKRIGCQFKYNPSNHGSFINSVGQYQKIMGNEKIMILEMIECMLKLNNKTLNKAISESGIVEISSSSY